MKNKNSEKGFHLIGLVIILAVIVAVGFIGYKVFVATKDKSSVNSTTSSGQVIWQYNQNEMQWVATGGVAPACTEPLKLDISPVDMSQVIAVGLPGQYRGYNYKAHGLFRLADSTNGNAEIKLPMDASLVGVTRYYESVPGNTDQLQYILDFVNDCGIAIRFDHLLTLTPEFQAIAEKTPQPKLNDTRRDANYEPIGTPYKAGTVVATAEGFPSIRNYGFDFGVYDYRKPNVISQNKEWAAIHKDFSSQHYHGICWIPLLPGADAAAAQAIASDPSNYDNTKQFNLTSDYCAFAPYNTLDFNNGQPTDG